MRQSHSSSWILVAGFLALGALNLVINPLAVQMSKASSDDCDDPEPTCSECYHPECDDGTWVCVQDTGP